MSTITVVAKIEAKETTKALVTAQLLQLVAQTRTEQGCLQYDLHQDLTNKNLFFMLETWESTASLDLHGSSAHLQAFVKATEGAFKDFSVHRLGKFA